jgi:hypothetical protein
MPSMMPPMAMAPQMEQPNWTNIAEQLKTQQLLERLKQLQAELSLTQANRALQVTPPSVASPNLLGMAIEPGNAQYPQMTAPPPSPSGPSPERIEADAWGRMQPGTQMHVLNGELPGMDWTNAPRDILPQLSSAALSQLRANAMLQDPAYQQYAQNVDAAKAAAAIGETPTHPGYLVGAALNKDFPVYTPEERGNIEKKRQGAVAKRNAELDERKLRVKAKAMGKEPMQVDMEQRMLAGQEPGLMDLLMVGGPQGLEAANARDPSVQASNRATAALAALLQGNQQVTPDMLTQLLQAADKSVAGDTSMAMDDMSRALSQSKGNMRAFMNILEDMGKSPEEIKAALAKYFPANKPGTFDRIGEGLLRLLEGSSTNGVPDVPGGFMAAG